MLEIVLLRHPETQWNRDKLIQGHTDIPPLDPTVPDSLVASLMELGSIVAVYSSDLLRCSLPASELYNKISQASSRSVLYQETSLLRERSFGVLEGKPYAEFGADNAGSLGEYLYRLPYIISGEDITAVKSRAFHASQLLLQHGTRKTEVVAVMTHGCFMNYVLNDLERRSDLSQYRVAGNLAGFRMRVEHEYVHEILPFPG